MPTSDAFVMVPVPTEHLEAVYALLAQRMGSSPSVGSDPSEEGLEILGQGMWTPDMVLRLKSALRHLPAALHLLDAAAQASPGEVSMQDVADAAGIARNKLRAQMGALSKVSVKLFGRRTWPLGIRYDELGRAFYEMPRKIAGWWID
jgi:hypothetical protein